jgi:hypothetical protein
MPEEEPTRYLVEYTKTGRHYILSDDIKKEEEAFVKASDLLGQDNVLEVTVWKEGVGSNRGKFFVFHRSTKRTEPKIPTGNAQIAVTLKDVRQAVNNLIEQYGADFPVSTPMNITHARFDEETRLWCGALLIAPRAVEPKSGRILSLETPANIVIFA